MGGQEGGKAGEEMSNHLLREWGMGFAGQGNVVKVSNAFPTASRSRRAQCGVVGVA